MKDPQPNLARIGALIGDPARASILWALMDGTRRPAGELAQIAGLSPQAASQHLAKLADGKLLSVSSCGRHRYFKIAGPEAARAIESLATFSPPPKTRRNTKVTGDIQYARSCYDHLAGELALQLMHYLLKTKVVEIHAERIDVTETGAVKLLQLGIDVAALRKKPRKFAATCLDWTERSHHISGALGAALLSRFIEMGWLIKTRGGRALRKTQAGKRGFDAFFNTPEADNPDCQNHSAHTE